MNTKIIAGVLGALIVLGGGWYLYQNRNAMPKAAAEAGQYAYECVNGTKFSMTPAEDASSVTIYPGASATFQKSTLAFVNGSAGQRFEGSGIVFVGAGEDVTLSASGSTTTCSPVSSTEMAPWNWGDAGEGGGVKQDLTVIVGESITGKWQSTTDAKFVREFKDGGTATDWYDNETQATGSWKIYTKDKPLSVSFPIMDNTPYVQIVMGSETLNFKVSKLTPDELELTYMDRGGTLTFKSVQ